MKTVLEQYERANNAYSQLNAENMEKINRLVAETLAKQQSQHQ